MSWADLKSKASVLLKNPYINALRGVPLPHHTGERAQIEISRMIVSSKGCLIARVGETEGRATAHYVKHRLGLADNQLSYDDQLKSRLKLLAGYFPTSDESIDQLAQLYLSAIESIDIYASWTKHDSLLCPSQSTRIRLIDLDPFFTLHKWTLALQQRSVCIVSPFVDSIKSQYKNKSMLFTSTLLPEMNLSFVRAPMTQCEADVSSQNWFDNLSSLIESVIATQCDSVIIGAGAYGLPIGEAAKKHGMSAIVMGGSTQLLFGIKGHRWENDRQYRRLFNEHWVRPSELERPDGYHAFEIKGGAYW